MGGRLSSGRMTDYQQVFRSVYVDGDIDAAVRARAQRTGASGGEAFRGLLLTGMARAVGDVSSTWLPAGRLKARTVFLPAELDANLRSMSYDQRTSENDLIRRLLRIGMSSTRIRSGKPCG